MGGDESDYSWSSDDELEKEENSFDPSSALAAANGGAFAGTAEASSSSGPSSTLFRHFVGAGFPENLVAKAIEENEEGNMDSILNALLTYAALESSPSDEQNVENPLGMEANGDLAQRTEELFDQNIDAESDQKNDDDSDFWFSDYDEITPEDFSDSDNCNGIEELSTPSEKDQKFLFLTDMGYPEDEVTIAMQRCGPDASIGDIADFLCAAQISRASDASYVDTPVKPKRKILECQFSKKKRLKAFFEDDEQIRLPKPMIGFGVPTEPFTPIHRTLPEAARGPPYFYYENVALAPKGVWDTISRFLYDLEPEFVDSKYFCAAARKRGYIHNLPIENRSPLLPIPPRSISEALPLTKKWWPHWDTRKKLNCLQTAIGSAKLTDRIRKALEQWDGDPPLHVQKYVLDECRKWNLVWVGRNKVAPLEPDEVEMLLGFPRNHTRGGGISRTDRYKSLGNSFQVDTVAYHLSVLKYLFPNGIKVLSLFSGIGGAEVALHRLGIPLKVVVSVEISEVNRNIMRSWWEQTNQKGTLIDIADVQQLTGDRLEHLIGTFGGFDLVIGGSPCNNLAGSNRVSRDGLEGKESSLFFDYCRILDLVKCIAKRQH